MDFLSQSGDPIKNETSSDCMVIVTTISGSKKIEAFETGYNSNYMSPSKGQIAIDSDRINSSNCGNTSEVMKSLKGKSSRLSKHLLEKENKGESRYYGNNDKLLKNKSLIYLFSFER